MSEAPERIWHNPIGSMSVEYVRADIHAAIEAENEQLRRIVMAQSKAIHSPRTEASAAVKVDRQALNLAISKWATDSDLHITIGDVEALHIAILSALSALTTPPAAPQGAEAVAWRVRKSIRGMKTAWRLSERPEIFPYECQPLYAAPPLTPVQVAEKAREAAAAIGVTPHSDMRVFVEQAVKYASPQHRRQDDDQARS